MPHPAPLTERLEHLRVLEEAAYRRVDPSWRIDLRPPVGQADLDGIQSQLNRRFSKDVIDLYRWHDGSDGGTWFVPLIHFNSAYMAKQTYDAVARFGALKVTNDSETIELIDLFPIFQHERILFSVRLARTDTPDTSPLFVIDFERGYLIQEARTLRDYIEHLIELFEGGHYEVEGRELTWTAAPYQMEPEMEPYGPRP